MQLKLQSKFTSFRASCATIPSRRTPLPPQDLQRSPLGRTTRERHLALRGGREGRLGPVNTTCEWPDPIRTSVAVTELLQRRHYVINISSWRSRQRSSDAPRTETRRPGWGPQHCSSSKRRLRFGQTRSAAKCRHGPEFLNERQKEYRA
jgi:hypothetical protein